MTGLEIAALLGAGGSIGGGLINSALSGIYSDKNLKFAKDQFEYQKQLNSQYLDRMDNRLQYLKKDAEKAGVNMLAALGQGGNYSALNAGTAPRQDNIMMSDLSNAMGNLVMVAKTMQDIKTAKSVENLNTQNAKTVASSEALNMALVSKHKQDLAYARKNMLPTGVIPSISNTAGEFARDFRKTFFDLDMQGYNPFSYFGNPIKKGYDTFSKIDGAVNSFTDRLMNSINNYFNNPARRSSVRRAASGR